MQALRTGLRLGNQAARNYGNKALDAAVEQVHAKADEHLPGVVSAFVKKGADYGRSAAATKLTQTMDALPGGKAGGVRQAIERKRDYGTSGFKLAKSMQPHAGVPKHVRDIHYHGIHYG